MSKDNPTQYHTRTIDLFLKSYFSGYASLNEAADVMFSANNLENHGYAVPAFVNDIENYLAKEAKIHSFSEDGRAAGEQAQIFNDRGKKGLVSDGKKHPMKGVFQFSFDDWHDCGPNGDNPNPEKRRKLCQKWWGWQMPTIPREGTPANAEQHPTRNMNMFFSQRHYPTPSASAPMMTQMINSIFNDDTDGENHYNLMDKAMDDMGITSRMALPHNMGAWSNSQGNASYRRQFVTNLKKYADVYYKRFGPPVISQEQINFYTHKENKRGNPITEEGMKVKLNTQIMKKLFLNHKQWELRGVPNDYLWENLYDEAGQFTDATTNHMRDKSEGPQSEKYRAGFFPMYFGIPLIDYEDGLKFAEWFLDGAGNSGGDKRGFDTKTVDNILGNNAYGWLSRQTQAFANALHGAYSGNISTSGTNSLPGGRVGRTKEQMKMANNKQLNQRLTLHGRGVDSHKNRNMDEQDVINIINDELGITRDEQNEILRSIISDDGETNLLDIIGEGHDTPDYHDGSISHANMLKIMKRIATVHGEKTSSYDNEDFLNNVKFIHKLKDKFFDPFKEVEVDKTILYYMRDAITGLEGARGSDHSHWGDLFDESFPSVFTYREHPDMYDKESDDEEEQEEQRLNERVLPSVKNTYGVGRTQHPSYKYENVFQKVTFHNSLGEKEERPQKTLGQRKDLDRAMAAAQLTDEEREELHIKFDNGESVSVEVPQGIQQDLRDVDNPTLTTATQAGDVSEEDYMLDKLPNTYEQQGKTEIPRSFDNFDEGDTAHSRSKSVPAWVDTHELSPTALTMGHSGLISAMLPHSRTNKNPNHFSAEYMNRHENRIENEGAAISTIKSARQARLDADETGGVSRSRATPTDGGNRRVSPSTFSYDIRGTEGGRKARTKTSKDVKGKSKESIHSSVVDNNDSRNRMIMMNTLMFQNHHGIDNYNEDDHNTHNKKQTMPHTVFESPHRDPLGRGKDAGKLYQDEITDVGGIESAIAIYDKEEYDKAMDRFNKGGILHLPNTIRDNINDRHELKQQLESMHHESDGTVMRDLNSADKNALRARMISDADFVGHYMDEDGLKKYTIKDTPAYAYQNIMSHFRQKARTAYTEGDKEEGLRYDILATKQNKLAADELGDLPPITKNELRKNYLQDAAASHQHSVSVSEIMKPLLKWANPELFQTHTPELNNQAWADIKMLAHLCETWSRTLSPKQKEDWIANAHVHCPKDGNASSKSVMDILRAHFKSEGLGDDAATNRIKGLVRDAIKPINRLSWQGDKNRARNVQGFGDDDEASILNLFEKYVNGELDEKHYPRGDGVEITKQIFEKVRETLPKGASFEDFADAIHARYVPHNLSGDNLTDEMTAEALVKYGKGSGSKRANGLFEGTSYDYKGITGGHHHENNELNEVPLKSGGESVDILEDVDGKGWFTKRGTRTMWSELRALNKAYQQLHKHTIATSNGIKGHANSTQPLTKKDKDWIKVLPKRMKDFTNVLKRDVTNRKNTKGEINSNTEEFGVGGVGINEIQLPAIHTCPATNEAFGHTMRPKWGYSAHALSQNNLVIKDHKGDYHGGGNTRLLAACPYAMRDFHPGLNPYDPSADRGTQYPPVQMQASGITGEEPNKNYPAWGDIGAGSQMLRSVVEELDCMTDDTLVFKADGRPVPVKAMHRIFDYSDLKNLRGFSGDWIASHIIDGEPVILQKKGKRIKAYNADMKLVELTDDMNDEMGKVSDKDFVVHAIIDGENLYFIDLLEAADEKTHNMPAKDRVRHLRAHFESSVHIKMPEPYNTKRADDEGLEQAIHLLREESSSDILLRDASTTYMRGETRHPKWVVLSKEKKVDVIILDRKGMNYRIGVGPIMHPENYGARSVEMEGEHYMDVGSAKGPRGYDKGEHATVFCTGATQSGEENPTYKIRSARIDRDAHPQAADSVETLSMLVNNAKIPHKVRLNKGSIHIIFPSLDDEVIYKVDKQEGGWMLEPQKTLWGQSEDYFIKLSEDMRPCWEPIASILLKHEENKREVKPELPAGHTKKRKEVLPEEEEIIKRGLEMAELMLERVSKEKITSTGVEGLGINYAGADVESPRGPTTNMTDDTNLDFNPSDRDYKEKAATTKKKTTHIRTTEGEEAITDNRGNVTITKPRV